MKRTKDLSRKALQIAEGVFSYSVDLTLWFVAYTSAISTPQRTTGQHWRAQLYADQFINQVNYDVIKQALKTAKHRGLLRRSKRHAWPEITKEGKRRLEMTVPYYDEKRIWDDRMHVVTYDIPEKRSKYRGLIRQYLKRIGCGRLQDSVWITPYNPIDTLRSFTEDYGLYGTIIVSDMGKDGSIGEEDLQTLIVRIYGLEELNGCYEKFLDATFGNAHEKIMKYLSIVRDDPQLPFSLLPKWWKGDEAYRTVREDYRKVLLFFRPEEK